MNKFDKNFTKSLAINTGSSTLGAGAGLIIGGPIGAIVGSVITPVATDVLSRMLSKKEKQRIEKITELARKLIAKKLADGIHPTKHYSHKSMKTLFEGALLTARDTYEDKKIPLIANLISLAPFTDIPNENLIQALKTAEQLTYRQICMISIIGQYQFYKTELSSKTIFEEQKYHKLNQLIFGVYHDLYYLCQIGMLELMEKDFDHVDGSPIPGNICPQRLKLLYPGLVLYNSLSLKNMKKDELSPILEVLKEKS